MIVSFLSVEDSEKWHGFLNRLPESDVYFLPEYHRAYELNGDGKATAFAAEEGPNLLFYPFLIRKIETVGPKTLDEPWYDLETVYGYSGPLCTTTDAAFLGKAWQAFAAWCQEKRILAEFIRFNPLIGNQRYMNDSCLAALDRQTVVLRLDCSEQELWQGYSKVHRRNVRRGVKKGFVCEERSAAEGLNDFKRLYEDTMQRAEALDYYYFSDTYYNHMFNALREKAKLFLTLDGDQIVAAEMVLLHDDRIHAHLAGSDERYKKYNANNFRLHGLALWGLRHGFRWLHLGGGRTPSPDDSLFRFKASISELRLPFFTGKRIHNRDVYERLCSMWMEQTKAVTRPNYFLLYRLEGTT